MFVCFVYLVLLLFVCLFFIVFYCCWGFFLGGFVWFFVVFCYCVHNYNTKNEVLYRSSYRMNQQFFADNGVLGKLPFVLRSQSMYIGSNFVC